MKKEKFWDYFKIITISLFVIFFIFFYIQTFSDYTNGFQRIVDDDGASDTRYYLNKNPQLFYIVLISNIIIPIIIIFAIIKGISYMAKRFAEGKFTADDNAGPRDWIKS